MYVLTSFLLLGLSLLHTPKLLAQNTEEALAFELAQLLDLGSDSNFFGPDRARLYSIGQVKQLYADRQFQALWTDSTGMSCLGYELAYELRQLRFDGLMPEDYHGELIREWQRQYRREAPSTTAIAYIELLLTDALMGAMTHLYYGKVDPESLRADYDIRRKSRQIEVLEKVVQIEETKEIRNTLEALSPGFSTYPRMRRQMKQLDQLRYGADTLSWNRLQVSRAYAQMKRMLSCLKCGSACYSMEIYPNQSTAPAKRPAAPMTACYSVECCACSSG
ncbi:ErfK/YbiS/YcfS/YnhG family protein [Nitritalea halalkaliphila LW7]|uniref:ErfK/YbiS/YcfS/YnhG family protein n=1 Tax=Nitritalea halalkaliphila LW7 TaxID=1189621 RepID=I5BY40_9BACT|nr:ErfK/YbiS/YcfS/YnhG family protein [Nitritalea halalkaliphila LW7]